MLRAISLFGFLAFCWVAASTAEACSYDVPRNPGESEAHAYERWQRANQDSFWAGADTIFVGRVVGLIMGDNGLEVSVQPRRSFKGEVGPDVFTYYLDGMEIMCERATFPDYDKVGIFYASYENDRLIVRGMLSPNDIEDDTLRARVLRELEPGELTTLRMETPRQDRWPLVLAGLVAFCAFIGGVVVGRMGRKRKVG